MNAEKIIKFADEIELISSEKLSTSLINFLSYEVPEYFWIIPASSTGKYHPAISQGDGGLIRHTKAVVALAVEQLQLYPMQPKSTKDSVIAAAILHDTFKYGLSGPTTEEGKIAFKNHGQVACTAWQNYCWRIDEFFDINIENAIKQHMSIWGGCCSYENMTDVVSKVVCMADFIASRSFIDFPEIKKEV